MLEAILFSAVGVNRIVEYFVSPIFENVKPLQAHKWALMYVAAALGVLVAFTYSLDLFALAGQAVSAVGQALTGVAIGGGANLIHDWIDGKPKGEG